VCPLFRASGSGASELSSNPVSEAVSTLGKGVDLVGSHSKPGLTIRLIVSPSFTAYSFSNLLSASALPFKSSLCASTGGAWGCLATSFFTVEIGSAGDTGMVTEKGGFRDLNVTCTVAGREEGKNWG